jgi:hypothetical protein
MDPATGTLAGESVAFVGDVDGDGREDFMLGAPRASGAGEASEGGAAFLVTALLSATMSPGPELGAAVRGEEGDTTGYSLAPAGDVNDDGLADVLVGVGGSDGTAYRPARVRLLLGPFSGEIALSGADPGVTGLNGGLGRYPNGCLAPMLDLDADGIADLAVGDPGDKSLGPGTGAVFVLSGPIDARRDLSSVSATLLGAEPYDQTGRGLGVGDLDGDGVGDLLVGAPYGGGEDRGAVWIWPGPLGGSLEVGDAPASISDPDGVSGYVGVHLLSKFDANDDGYDDILLSATEDRSRGTMKGAVYLFPGPVLGHLGLGDAVASFFASPPGFEAGGWGRLGETTSAGDLDGDGWLDLVISAPSSLSTAAWALRGPFEGARDLASEGLLFVSEDPDRAVGASVATGGDLDGDGLDEVLLGSPHAPGQGAVFLFLGASLAWPG